MTTYIRLHVCQLSTGRCVVLLFDLILTKAIFNIYVYVFCRKLWAYGVINVEVCMNINTHREIIQVNTQDDIKMGGCITILFCSLFNDKLDTRNVPLTMICWFTCLPSNTEG